MAGRRLSMRKIKEVLRLKWENGCSNTQVSKSCNIARSTVREYLRRARDAGLSWPLDPHLDDTALENLLFPVKLGIFYIFYCFHSEEWVIPLFYFIGI